MAADYREPSLSSMPSFAMRDINDACLIMHEYIEDEQSTLAQKIYKHRALEQQTSILVATLSKRGKLQGSPDELDAACANYN